MTELNDVEIDEISGGRSIIDTVVMLWDCLTTGVCYDPDSRSYIMILG